MRRRYISERFLPDKAIDLVDEAAAKMKMDATSRPQALDEVDRRLMQCRMEEISLKADAENDARAASRLAALRSEMATLEDKQAELESKWSAEKNALEGINKLKEAIDKMNLEIEKVSALARTRAPRTH